MTTGRGQFERTPSAFLAAHVGEVERTPSRLAVADDELGRLELSPEIGHRVGEVAHADRLDARERRLRAGFVGTDDTLQVGATRAFGHGQHAADTTKASIQRKLSARRMLGEPCPRQLVRRCEQRQGDRQIESRPLLLQLRRREVDGEPVVRPLQFRGEDPTANSLLRLLTRAIGEPDDRQTTAPCCPGCALPPRPAAARDRRGQR